VSGGIISGARDVFFLSRHDLMHVSCTATFYPPCFVSYAKEIQEVGARKRNGTERELGGDNGD
jgi:hypothetical protein